MGGGKKVRAKYTDSLPMDLAASLKSVGYVEDSAASLCISSSGTFKYQHNTDTDLKNIYVFPKVYIKSDVGDVGDKDEHVVGATKGNICLEVTLATFQETIGLKVQSFGQKKMLIKKLKEVMADITKIDAKLVAMEALTPVEEKLYHSATDIPEKIEWLQKVAQDHVDKGQLTKSEKAVVLSTLTDLLTGLDAKIEVAAGDAKRLVKLEEMKAKLTANKAKVSSLVGIKRVIKHAEDIAKLEFATSVLKRQMDTNSASLSDMHEYGIMTSKIARLRAEQEEANWFEDPVLFEKVSLGTPKGKSNSGSGNHSSTSGTSSSSSKKGSGSSDVWSTIAKTSGNAVSAKKSGARSNAFAGLSIDADSD